MKDISKLLNDIYLPRKALLLYQSLSSGRDVYMESYDIAENGQPINAHPLSREESVALAEIMQGSEEEQATFLACRGLMPENILCINTKQNGFAIWYTPAEEVSLLFKNSLTIPSGKAFVPPLLWKAYRNELYIYAMNEDGRPSEKTPLYYAPFFNLYEDGRVCMGTVDIDISPNCSLKDFISRWQQYFFGSYFSHLIQGKIVKGNIIQLWQQQMETGKPFPSDRLIKTSLTLKKLL